MEKKAVSGIMLTLLLINTLTLAVNFHSVKASVDWWPMFHHDLSHTGYSTSTAPNTNNVLWSYLTGGSACYESSLAIVDSRVYFGSNDYKVYCLNANTGAFIWSYTTGDWVESSPAIADGRVYVGSDDRKIYCLNSTTGAFIWSYLTGGKIWSSPVVAYEKTYFGSLDKKVYCLNAITGAFVWSYTTGDYVFGSSPAVVDNKVYIGSWDKKIYCLNAITGAFIWSYTTAGVVSSSPSVVDGKVYVGSGDYKVYCLNATSGTFIWSYTTGYSVLDSPAVAYGKVYIGSSDNKVYCLNAISGTFLWSYTTGGEVGGSPAVADGKVYIGSYDRRLYCLNATAGTIIWYYAFTDPLSDPAIADGKVYVGSRDWKVYCFGSPPEYTLTITATAGGITSPAPGTYTYPSGTVVGVTAIPNANYVLDHWELDGANVGSANPYSVLMNAGHTLHAVFSIPPPPWGDWAHYHNYSEIVNTILYLNGKHPNIVDVFSIGKSWQNRDIYCIRLTNESNTHPKPKVFFVGYHHARELISTELPLYFAVEAATNFGTNPTITHMLNYSEIYIVVALNVDSFDVVKQNEWQRKNVHPFDEDGDTLLDEDPPDDQDGDGYIEDLFFYNGTHYYFIRWEGIDDDGDGLLNEDWVGGVDLNRNYGYQWNATCQSGSPYPWAEDYRGPAPFSEPETQAIRDLALQQNFKYAISFHSGSENIGYPWGYTNTPTPHDQTFREVAGNLSALVGAPYGQSGQWYTISGSWDDWMYGNRSTFPLTCEIYTNGSAWQYEPGPYPNTWWEKGVFQFFNPAPSNITKVIQRWLPVFTYITNRAITEAYDTATTKVTPLKTVVGQGFSMQIDVTVANQGDFTETFNVKVYANTTSIASQPVTLTRKSSTTITFTWNTAGLAKGNYTISAYAEPVPGETDTTDNTRKDGWVIVAMKGDISGTKGVPDGKVDIDDVVPIALAFASIKGTGGNYWHSPACKNCPHNPNYDLTNDGIIDIDDVIIPALNFGKIDP